MLKIWSGKNYQGQILVELIQLVDKTLCYEIRELLNYIWKKWITTAVEVVYYRSYFQDGR